MARDRQWAEPRRRGELGKGLSWRRAELGKGPCLGEGPSRGSFDIIFLMKLEYAKRGLQFFFVTLVVAERRKVLSSIAKLEASGQAGATGRAGRPELLPLGEIVAAALRAIHRV